MAHQTRQIDLTSEPVFGCFMRLAVPAAIGMICSTLYNVVDAYFAGQLGNSEQAGISIGFQAFILLLAFGYGTGSALSALVGEAKGSGSAARVRAVTLGGLMFVLLLCCMLTAIGLVSGPKIIALVTEAGNHRALALVYFQFLLLALPGFLFAYAGNGILHAFGDSRSLTVALCVAFLLNCTLTPLLIYGVPGVFDGIGFWGIPIVTIFSQTGVGAFVVWQIFRQPEMRNKHDAELGFSLAIQKMVAFQAIPTSFVFLISFISGFVVQYWLKDFGEVAQAAYGITLRIQQLFLLPIIGITIALVPIVAQNLSAGMHERARLALRICIAIGLCLSAIVFCIVWFFGGGLASIFTDDPNVILAAVLFMRFEAVAMPLYAVLFSMNAILQAMRKAIWTFVISLYRQVLALVSFIWVLTDMFGLNIESIYSGVFASNVTGTIFALFLFWVLVPRVLVNISNGRS